MPALAAPLLKICGLTDPGQAKMVAALGVDAIGVIGVETSPRFVAAARRSEVFNAVAGSNPNCQRVLVVADPLTDAMITPEIGRAHV